MKHIYINTFNNSITLKDKKFKTIKRYENLSRNSDEELNSIKLIIFAINKISVLDRDYNEEYIFYITDNDVLKYIKDENNFFYKKVDKNWKYNTNNKTLSEVGRMLSLFSKFNFIDIKYFVYDEEYKKGEEIDRLSAVQSEYDTKIQDYLHDIQKLKEKEITEELSVKLIKEIRNLRIKRENIKREIKKMNRSRTQNEK